MTEYHGNLLKMESVLQADRQVNYRLPVGEYRVELHPNEERELSLHFSGNINCIACGRSTKKSYSQGHCFPCSQRLARCDLCIVRPEKCHYAMGSCREPEWGEANCMQTHFVYLANTSGVKVGITRAGQIPTRWIDQGATQALPIFQIDTRYHAGLIEVIMKNHVADRTDWRRMLKGDEVPLDLVDRREALLADTTNELQQLADRIGAAAFTRVEGEDITEIAYPVLHYPEKVKALNLDKQAEINGRLLGIKGQYLIFDCGVLNIRKFAGYHVTLSQ